MTLVSDFFLSPIHYIFFLLVEADTFKLSSYFRALRLLCGLECFPEPVKITELSGQGVRGIILANCKLSASSRRFLRVHHVCLWSIDIFS